jgi:CDGSH-type Zn-finger protein
MTMENSGVENVLTAQVLKDGPLIVDGTIKVVDANGNEVVQENKTAFCRCGASSNKPYCDGSHKGIGFEG